MLTQKQVPDVIYCDVKYDTRKLLILFCQS